jgi:hypothetical protein
VRSAADSDPGATVPVSLVYLVDVLHFVNGASR